jgi:hypothetical protein
MANEKKSFDEIMSMISSSCNRKFYTGTKGREEVVIKCATDIYIAQMNEPTEKGGSEN